MKINFIKAAGGSLIPNDDMDAEKMTKFLTGEVYEVDIKLSRNPAFLRKTFAFFNFCFEHWDGIACFEYLDHTAQFETFRKELTILAGFYVKSWHPFTGALILTAKSLSFENMKEEEFQEHYNALIKAALANVFKTADQNTYNKLISFF